MDMDLDEDKQANDSFLYPFSLFSSKVALSWNWLRFNDEDNEDDQV